MVAGFKWVRMDLIWNVTGDVTINVTNTGGGTNNAVVSGLFFG